MTSEPVMSVVVMVDRQRQRGERCLRSILDQNIVSQLEILLLDFASTELPPLAGSDHPSVRVVPMNYATGFGGSRVLGVRMARAPIVAFLEEHVTVRPGWAEATVQAHQHEWAGVGPQVHNPAPGHSFTELIYLMGFGPWAPPMPSGESQQICNHNSAYKRDLLLRYHADLERLLESDILLQWRLREDGYKLFQTSAAQIEHATEMALPTIMVGYYWVMRFFAPLRAEIYHWSPLRRLLRLLLTPLAPFYRATRLIVGLARRRSPYFWTALRGAGVMIVAHLGGAAGEAVGLLAGRPPSDHRFLLYEMNTERASAKAGQDTRV